MQLTCTLCGQPRAIEKVVVYGNQRICEGCVWRLVDELESRGSLRPGSLTAPRALPCTICERGAEHATVVDDVRVCGSCAQEIAHLVLSSSREQIEDVWGVELPENTKMRRASEEVATELRHGARTHAKLAEDLVDAGDVGQALTEAAIALVSDPDDKQVAEMALTVLLRAGTAVRNLGLDAAPLASVVASLKSRLPRTA